VHHAAHLWRRQENAVLHSLDTQKSVAGAVSADLALDDAACMGTR
jgi:hypothetical protein